MGSFSYTSRTGLIFLLGEFLLHIPCWVHFYQVCFSSTSRAGFFFYFIFIWGVSLTNPVLASFFLFFLCYKSRAGFFFVWGVSLTHPVLAAFYFNFIFLVYFFVFYFVLFLFCFLNLRSLSYTSIADFIFMLAVSPTHPVLPSFLSGEILLLGEFWIYFF